MNPSSLSAASEMLQHYSHDSALKWTHETRESQQAFVSRRISGRNWLDWSTESVALQLMQAVLASMDPGFAGKHDAILLAGPITEFLDLDFLLEHAVRRLAPGGVLIGIIPCLRDNSPESSLFCEVASEFLWPYHTAEEGLEFIHDAGLKPNPNATRFVPIPEFNEAVIKDLLAFKGYRKIFDRIEEQGYDSTEVGWGELRFEAITG